MGEEVRKAPNIRFKGFTDEWEQRKLGDTLRELKSGLSRMLSDQDIGLPVVRANNINDGQFNISTDVKYWYKNDPQGAKTENYLVEKGDILINFINSEAKMGTATIVKDELDRKIIYTTNILRARVTNNYDNNFWFALTLTYKYKNDIKTITKPAVNQASFTTVDFKNLRYYFPKVEEQSKIGEYFSSLDNLITIHQRRLDLLKVTKKSMLQKMFPKDGESVPEIRFAGFTDAWEPRKLGNVKDVRDGTHDSPKYLNEGYPLITSKNLTEYGLDISNASFISTEDFEAINKRSKVDVGDIIFGMIGTIGNPIILEFDELAIKNVALIKRGDEVENNFLIHLLKSSIFTRYIEKENAGGTQKFLGLNQIRNFMFFAPSREEQRKIGEHFSSLDHLITLHQRELDLLKDLKKSMLQQMFI